MDLFKNLQMPLRVGLSEDDEADGSLHVALTPIELGSSLRLLIALLTCKSRSSGVFSALPTFAFAAFAA